ncbi:MAG: nucleotide exchange factor GrpE [Anaerolineae bacterium]|nr:nucleotide exchange factor GrpE [Anaerolineae bacterium]
MEENRQEETATNPEEEPEVISVEGEVVSTEEESQGSVETQLAEAEQKVAEYMDGWQRCQATFSNYRKRTEAEQVNLRKLANAGLLTRLLSILDDFERAFQAIPAEFAGNAWVEGITLIQRKAQSILDVEEVTQIEIKPGDVFDPMYHQAILHQEVPGFEDGQIVAEVSKGYMLGDRVLRPSTVVVAKATSLVPAGTANTSATEVSEEAAGDIPAEAATEEPAADPAASE